jgi:hypothetical protein
LNLSRSEIGSLTARKEHNFFHQLKSCLTIPANEIMCPKLHSSNCNKQFTTKSQRSQTTWNFLVMKIHWGIKSPSNPKHKLKLSVGYRNQMWNKKSEQPRKNMHHACTTSLCVNQMKLWKNQSGKQNSQSKQKRKRGTQIKRLELISYENQICCYIQLLCAEVFVYRQLHDFLLRKKSKSFSSLAQME